MKITLFITTCLLLVALYCGTALAQTGTYEGAVSTLINGSRPLIQGTRVELDDPVLDEENPYNLEVDPVFDLRAPGEIRIVSADPGLQYWRLCDRGDPQNCDDCYRNGWLMPPPAGLELNQIRGCLTEDDVGTNVLAVPEGNSVNERRISRGASLDGTVDGQTLTLTITGVTELGQSFTSRINAERVE